MKKSAYIKRITAILLILVMLLLTSCGTVTEEEDTTLTEAESIFAENYTDTTENVKKTETVYANLNPDGSQRLVTVSDWLHADRSKVKVSDITTLENYAITKGHASAAAADGSVTWHMASSDVYYEGTTDKELPVGIDIKYYLNGAPISAEEIAGQSGDFRMEITLTNRISYEVEINGVKYNMYAPFVVAGGMMLDYQCFSEIEVENGMTVGSGTYEMVMLAGVPGINESLGLDSLNISGFEDFSFSDTFTITAKVTDFRLGDGYFMIAPLSSLNLDLNMPQTLEDAQSILNEVNDIKNLLNKIDPNGQLAVFMSDSDKVLEMMDIMKRGLTVYSENKAMLNVMSEYMTPENVENLTNFLNSLDTEEINQLVSILSNVPGLQSILSSMLTLSEGLDDVMPIIEGFATALEDPEVAASFEKLPETMETLNELADFMNENEEVLDILTQLMTSDELDQFTGTLDTVISENGNNIGSAEISSLPDDAQGLIARMQEWIKLDYSIFTAAPDYMETSCTFICKTDPVK